MRIRFAIQLLVAALLLAQGKPDFTGRWELDKAHSTAKTTLVKHPDLKGPPVPLAPEGHALDWIRPETITHHEPSLVVVDESVDNRPARRYRLSTDGKPSVSALPGGGVDRSTTRWDRDRLVTEWVLEQSGIAIMRGTDQRSLSS
ncbi:MAG: hypothetical protein KGM92_13285, partial [Acidobacteriota bacterium]|nr:hypothetical protein [Acidobacteriota bacterium]